MTDSKQNKKVKVDCDSNKENKDLESEEKVELRSEPTSPGEAFKDIKLRKSCGEILLSRYLKVSNYVLVNLF